MSTEIAAVKIPRAMRNAKRLKEGIRGEQHVGQYLDRTCRRLGYSVFHDVPAEGSGGHFNIDHVLIGPGGVFSVETKNWSLPPKGTRAEVEFDPAAAKLTWPDGRYDTAAANQAINNAEYVRKVLAERTGRAGAEIPVRPVLLLPGWFITNTEPLRRLWVFSNETLHAFLLHEGRRLSDEEVAALATELTNYVRNFGK